MNFINILLKIMSKGFDLSCKMVKNNDTKAILAGLSAIFALSITGLKLYQNYISFKRLFKRR